MTRRTPLFEAHQDSGARMVEFYGWDMPLNYGSQIEEHHAVRAAAGMFDVSHMTIVDVVGADAEAYLRKLVANDVAKLDVCGALYGLLLLESAGILDDLIVYRREEGYRCIVNAGTRGKVLSWMDDHASNFSVSVSERDDLAMIAVQGPAALRRLSETGEVGDTDTLARFAMLENRELENRELENRELENREPESGEVMIARTGYTGEDGVEIMLGADAARDLWAALLAVGGAAGGARCARHVASGGGTQSVRSGHERRYPSARVQPGMDHRLATRGA